MRPRRLGLFVLILCMSVAAWRYRSHKNEKRGIDRPNDGEFKAHSVAGYVNTVGNPCSDMYHEGEIYVQQSFRLEGDLYAVADELDDHPMIVYEGQDPRLSREELVSKTWARMMSSSVWLSTHQVYFTVSRVYFYDKGNRGWPVISFLRGQIYDDAWDELRGYTIEWYGEKLVFPRTFDIPSHYNQGGGVYGPEDPRIIIENGDFEAGDMPEPVIVFNMLMSDETARRAMYIFRPFTNHTTVLEILERSPALSEKNWTPFFVQNDDQSKSRRRPANFLHFIYLFDPLTIIQCELYSGWCHIVYEQAGTSVEHHSIETTFGTVVRGGTNLVSFTNHKTGTQSFFGIARTLVPDGPLLCTSNLYRPLLMLLVATSPTHFHISYVSDPVDFGDAVLSKESLQDPCNQGRILMLTSISSWNKDIMTVSFSVDDKLSHVVRLQGVEAFLRKLQHSASTLKTSGGKEEKKVEHVLDIEPLSLTSSGVILCAVESAVNYTLARARPAKMEVASEMVEERPKEPEESAEELMEKHVEYTMEDTDEDVEGN